MTVEEMWDYLLDNGIAQEETLQVVCNINGYTTQTMEDVLYVLTGEREFDQNINLNPRVSTYQEYLKALQNPKTNEDAIISYCQNEYLTNTLYKRNFDY